METNYSQIILNIVTIISIIVGLNYLRPIKNNVYGATFTYWENIKVRLSIILQYLSKDYNIINNLYSKTTRENWSGALTPNDNSILRFKNIVDETLKYIESAENQMPVYVGWSKDYQVIINFLVDVVVNDITNPNNFFKYKNKQTMMERDNYCKKICSTISTINNAIIDKQTILEKQLCRYNKISSIVLNLSVSQILTTLKQKVLRKSQ